MQRVRLRDGARRLQELGLTHGTCGADLMDNLRSCGFFCRLVFVGVISIVPLRHESTCTTLNLILAAMMYILVIIWLVCGVFRYGTGHGGFKD